MIPETLYGIVIPPERRSIMKILVTYLSQTGNTESVARAIHDSIEGAKEIHPFQEMTSVEGYGLVFVGFPVHGNSVPPKIQPFLKSLPKNQPVAFFHTHAALRGSELARTGIENALALASQVRVLGTFACQGKVRPAVIESLRDKPENRKWCEEAQAADGHPDAADLADARAFAVEILAKATALKT
jgi:flavodoxin